MKDYVGGYKEAIAAHVYENSCHNDVVVLDENGKQATVNAWAPKLGMAEKTLRDWIKKFVSTTNFVPESPKQARLTVWRNGRSRHCRRANRHDHL